VLAKLHGEVTINRGELTTNGGFLHKRKCLLDWSQNVICQSRMNTMYLTHNEQQESEITRSPQFPVLHVTPGESALTYEQLRKYVCNDMASQIQELYHPSTEELRKHLGTTDEVAILTAKLTGPKFINLAFDELTPAKNGSLKGTVFLNEYASMGPACAIATLNLLPKITGKTNRSGTAFPIQQQQLINAMSDYRKVPKLLPWLGTSTGRTPKRAHRDWIGAVLKVVLANTCFHTWRIGRYHSSGEFVDLSVLELAREGGFTKMEKAPKLDKNGNELPGEFYLKETEERSFLRAWSALRNSYIESYQPKLSPNEESDSGWHRSYKILNPKLIHHIRKVTPPRWMPNAQFSDLVKQARKRSYKAEKKSRANRIKDFEQSKLQSPVIRKLVAKLNKQRAKFAKELVQLGHLASVAMEFAILVFSLPYSLLNPGKRQFGKPGT